MLLFVSAFGLGLALFAIPGAITAQLLRGLGQRGFLWALFVQLGALLGLILWAVIAFVGAALLVQNTLARVMLGATGVLLLLWLAWQAKSAPKRLSPHAYEAIRQRLARVRRDPLRRR